MFQVEIDKEVKVLLDLKAEYKKLTGVDFGGAGEKSQKKHSNSTNGTATVPSAAENASREVKKVTRQEVVSLLYFMLWCDFYASDSFNCN